MFRHESEEDYVECIYMLNKQMTRVRAIDVAKTLSFSKPSVSIALKKLQEKQWISIEGNSILLTEKGKQIAEQVYERHQFISQLFIQLGVNADTAKKDACAIEHVLSEESFNAIKSYAKKHLEL